MKTFLYKIIELISDAHSFFLSLNDEYEYNFSDKELHFLVIGVLGMAFIFVVYLIFKWLPEKENEKIIEKQGGIRFPNGLTPFSEKKYFSVEDSLRSAGFKNISCVNLHDLNLLTALVSSDKIDKITINGSTIMSGGKIYMPDVPIVITYQ